MPNSKADKYISIEEAQSQYKGNDNIDKKQDELNLPPKGFGHSNPLYNPNKSNK